MDHPVHGLFGLEGVDNLEKKIVFGMQMQSQQLQSQLQQQQQQQQQQSHEEEVDGVLVQKEEVEGEVVKEEEKKEMLSNVEEFTAQVQSFVYLLDKTDSSLDKAVRGHLVFKDRMLAVGMRMRQYLLFGFQSRK